MSDKLKNRIRVGRAEKELTQEQLAEMVGVARQTISLIEKGKHIPSIVVAIKIAKALDMQVSECFILSDE